MIGIDADATRLFLHVLAATIWVGGQLVLAALVPTLRKLGPDVPGAAARQFNRVAWPTFAVLLVTGAWNVSAEHDEIHGHYQVTLVMKLVVVALSGLTAWAHIRSTTTRGRAVFGALTGLTAIGALLLGVLLAG